MEELLLDDGEDALAEMEGPPEAGIDRAIECDCECEEREAEGLELSDLIKLAKEGDAFALLDRNELSCNCDVTAKVRVRVRKYVVLVLVLVVVGTST